MISCTFQTRMRWPEQVIVSPKLHESSLLLHYYEVLLHYYSFNGPLLSVFWDPGLVEVFRSTPKIH